jgi:hypothetical protein
MLGFRLRKNVTAVHFEMVQEQFGFREETSAEDAVCQLTDSVFKSLNQKGMLVEFSAI